MLWNDVRNGICFGHVKDLLSVYGYWSTNEAPFHDIIPEFALPGHLSVSEQLPIG